jgi:hypothetical protein
MAQELCQCQAATHGHEPGKCPNPATEPDNLCKACHDATVAPSGGAAFGETPFGSPKPSDG